MKTELQRLPFVPPVEGCQIDRVHHIGPFITRVELRLPDGRPFVWTSRRHRFAGQSGALPGAGAEDLLKARWWSKIKGLAGIVWWIAILFMVGSTCFGVASAAGLAPGLFGSLSDDPFVINVIFFIGSIFFTSAAYLQFLGAVNADRISAVAQRRVPGQGFRWFSWEPRQIGWLSAFTQFVGTLLFNVNTFDVLLPGLNWLQEDLLIWTPDALGSVCFLVASVLALLELGDGSLTWRPRDVSWWIVMINLAGSVAFGVAAVEAVILPETGELLDVQGVNFWTLVGALCFFTGAWLLLPELRRNLAKVVVWAPSD